MTGSNHHDLCALNHFHGKRVFQPGGLLPVCPSSDNNRVCACGRRTTRQAFEGIIERQVGWQYAASILYYLRIPDSGAVSRVNLNGGKHKPLHVSRVFFRPSHLSTKLTLVSIQLRRIGRSTPRASAKSQRAGAGVPTGRTFLASRAATRGSNRSTRT